MHSRLASAHFLAPLLLILPLACGTDDPPPLLDPATASNMDLPTVSATGDGDDGDMQALGGSGASKTGGSGASKTVGSASGGNQATGGTEATGGNENQASGGAPGAGGTSSGGTSPGSGGAGSGGAPLGSGGVDAGGSATFAGYPAAPSPDPTLPTDDSLDIMIVADPGVSAPNLAAKLHDALTEKGDYPSIRVDSSSTTFGGLMDYFYGASNRDTRLAALDDGYDYVVLLETAEVPNRVAEGHFAAVLGLADHIRALGATPVLVMTDVDSPKPNEQGQLCSNHCWQNNDGTCNDGGVNAFNSLANCGLGSDCADCGVRTEPERNRMSMGERFWRIATGAGVVPVAAATLMGELEIAWGERGDMFIAALYSAFTNESVRDWSGWSTEGEWPARADAMLAHLQAQEGEVHYTGAHVGHVRIEPIEPVDAYRYIVWGTSSEHGYGTAMDALLAREGYTISRINEWPAGGTSKSVRTERIDAVVSQMGGEDYFSVFARGYSMTRAQIDAAVGSSSVQPQIFDRHYDDVDPMGINATDDMYARMRQTVANGLYFNAVWIPHHINFAKYRLVTGAALKTDTAHATSAVQSGLAAMSYVSRTGLSPTTQGVDSNTAHAIEIGEHTIRTLSTYSRTGLHIPDVPADRPSLR